MIDFLQIVKEAVTHNASDIHLSAFNRPACRINGKILFRNDPPLTSQDVEKMIQQCLSRDKFAEFIKTGDVDAAVEITGCGRFRLNAFRQIRGCTLVLRVINSRTPELRELHLPESIDRILSLKDGLVLVTGPTGSGKSTTLAALINELNKGRNDHIITIEDPIEYMHKPIGCIIDQREVGSDSVSYACALRAALREDPDIILVGEMRDLESISIAITAAETGHLVFSTLHTNSSSKTIDRLIDVFPADQQQQIRTELSLVLKCVVSQRLLPTADSSGRVAAFEIMYVNNAISNLIREGKTANISQIIQTGTNTGMITMKKSIWELLRRGIITKEVAEEYSFDAASAVQATFPI